MAEASAPQPISASSQRILLVDDDVRVRELLLKQLQLAGFYVQTAEHGLHALQRLTAEPYDLVLSDTVMPELGGIQLVHEIKQRYPQMHVMLMTGHSKDAVSDADQETGHPILRKPFSYAELLHAVRHVLGAASTHPSE
jgi:DNA-binding NtrC family response regulator